METKQVLETYDDDYAATYNQKFLLNESSKRDADFEASLLRQFLNKGATWLDVACGTGYFLSLFPDVKRAGLDISPAMLAHARRVNPGVEFFQRSFLDETPEWEGRWDVVSCMWYAYALVPSMGDIKRVVDNLGRWTAKGGTCFLPVCDPSDMCKTKIPYLDPDLEFYGGQLMITGVTWTWIETDGKRHDDVVAPHVPHMVAMLEPRFQDVEVVGYPPPQPGWASQRKAIVARKKR
jgi:SAM-dependent methyltransferase